MTSPWSSGLKLSSFVTQTLQNVERSIDKAIGIPEGTEIKTEQEKLKQWNTEDVKKIDFDQEFDDAVSPSSSPRINNDEPFENYLEEITNAINYSPRDSKPISQEKQPDENSNPVDTDSITAKPVEPPIKTELIQVTKTEPTKAVKIEPNKGIKIESTNNHKVKGKSNKTQKIEQSTSPSERENSLLQIIYELRTSLQRAAEHSAIKEEELNNEINSLKLRLKAADNRNEELATSLPETTRPLLRQIDALQLTLSERTNAWDELEKSLNNRLLAAESRARRAEDQERSAQTVLNEQSNKLKKIESEYAECRNTVARVTAQLEIENNKAAEKQKELEKLNGQLAALTIEHEKYVNEAKLNESKLLKTITELKEKEELLNKEIEKFKKLKEMERLELYRPNKATMPPSPNASPSSPSNNTTTTNTTAAPLPSTPTSPSSPALQSSSSGNKLDILAFPNSGASHIPALEKLQTTLRQKEGEIASLQAQISNLEKTKGVLQEELVSLTSKNEALQSEVNELKKLKQETEEMRTRYNTALELIGEKDEELEELRADIVDMKDLYKKQINELLEKIECSNTA